MTTKLTIDPRPLDWVMETSGESTLTGAETVAHKEVAERRAQQNVTGLSGAFEWDSNFDYKAERSRA